MLAEAHGMDVLRDIWGSGSGNEQPDKLRAHLKATVQDWLGATEAAPSTEENLAAIGLYKDWLSELGNTRQIDPAVLQVRN